jgi:two-component sensor histidine kinase
MRRSLAIRWHLAIFGIIIVLPFLLVGLFISVQYIGGERARAQRTAHDLVQTVTAAIDAELERYRLALWVLSTSRTLVDGDYAAFYERAKKLAQELPGVVIALRELDGQPIFLTSLPFGTQLKPNADGVLLDADREAIARGRTVVSNLFHGGTTEHLFVAIDQPIVTGGQVIALLSIGIPPTRLQEVLLEQVKTGWLFGVTDNNGRLVARTWEFERFVGQSATTSFLERTLAASGDFTNVTLDGIPVYNVWRRSPLTGWRMSVGIPSAELEAPVRQSVAILGALALVGVLVSLLLAMLYGRWLIERIKALQLYALAIGRREEASPALTGIFEFDEVVRSLTEAGAALKKHSRIQNSLVDELNHRVKNTLAIIQSIARQTRKRSSSLDEFGAAFEGRLMALASSHDALTRSGWRGSNLEDIVRAACRPFADDDHIEIDGEPVELRSNAVVSLAMVLHELATNAAKYGSLSAVEGRVAVRWRVDCDGEREKLNFEWKELNGPPVGPLHENGFGSLLISSLVANDLGGKGAFFAEPEGLRFSASFPLPRSEQAPSEADVALPRLETSAPLAPPK